MELSTDSRASVSCFGFAVGTGLGNSELGIVERPLMPEPKPFQEAAIRSACESFKAAEGSRRFLVADEVGLGKTVVAQQVIERLAGKDRRSPFVVYYITNGQRVANQNRGRLIDFLDRGTQKEALSKADRLNLIPLYPRPSAPVALYALTPGTSFPGRSTRLHAGRKEERNSDSRLRPAISSMAAGRPGGRRRCLWTDS